MVLCGEGREIHIIILTNPCNNSTKSTTLTNLERTLTWLNFEQATAQQQHSNQIATAMDYFRTKNKTSDDGVTDKAKQ